MAIRPNYRHDRAERTRSKQAKKLEKLRAKEEQAAQRKAADGETLLPASDRMEDEGVSGPMEGDADAVGLPREEED